MLLNSLTQAENGERRKLCHEIVVKDSLKNRAYTEIQQSLTCDPLPVLRQIIERSGNDYALKYMRQVRAICGKLLLLIRELNIVMNKLFHYKSTIHQIIQLMRIVIENNNDVCQLRSQMRDIPRSTRKGKDVIDKMLAEEKIELITFMKIIDIMLGGVNDQLRVRNEERSRVENTLKEREVVVDLIPQSWTKAAWDYDIEHKRKKHQYVCDSLNVCDIKSLEPFNLDSQTALTKGTKMLISVKNMINELQLELKNRIFGVSERTHMIIDAFKLRLAKYVSYEQLATLSRAEAEQTRRAVQRSDDRTQYVNGILKGPINAKYLTTSERLNRPLITHLQRHPGNQLPDAGHLRKIGGVFSTATSLEECIKRNFDPLKESIKFFADMNKNEDLVILEEIKLYSVDKYEKGEKYFKELTETLSQNDISLPSAYQQLDVASCIKQDYIQVFHYYNKSLDLLLEHHLEHV
ncbi:unnamed protein product [Didymodactylos carnosus]|uniref:Uncharacterized protein n=1 Tax=Didymodactylos carnosus TaxID=1234261 RepID=A0A814A674_9BILA|nr:unnamed protein product [Didymodactylos carnosus]CAF0917953.1 unnamed protein product [Didymodactylos carnosus]CAF3690014.1 unnamed protein product [Didymodactylos carnosus]CAF3695920.1 unnamed protein product [Didymodactylos carnosus]